MAEIITGRQGKLCDKNWIVTTEYQGVLKYLTCQESFVRLM